jgi:hypothetical protein
MSKFLFYIYRLFTWSKPILYITLIDEGYRGAKI